MFLNIFFLLTAQSSKYHVITVLMVLRFYVMLTMVNNYTFFGAVYLTKIRSATWFQTVVMVVDDITVIISVWFLA